MRNNRKAILLFFIGLLIIGAAALNREKRSDDEIEWFIEPLTNSFYASGFRNGVARIACREDRNDEDTRYIDIFYNRNGAVISKKEFESAMVEDTVKNQEIPNLGGYDYISDFHEGLAVAVKEHDSIINQEYYFVDERGEVVFGHKFDFAHDFEDGLAVVQFAGDRRKYSVIDRNGDIVLKTAYTRMMPFQEGLAPFFNRNKKKWGYIDIKGNKVVPELFEDARCFNEGLAAVKVKEGWGYIKNPLDQ
jgi:hypothetical protein